MNKLESKVHKLIKGNPKLKNRIRNLYQLTMAIIPVHKVDTKYKIINRPGYYFGFHDKTPFSSQDEFLLAHKYNGEDNRTPEPDEWVEVGYFEGNDYLYYKPLAKSYAWNWTQGSMLQWVGKTNNIVFNDFNGENHVAKIIDKNGNLIKKIPEPIGAVSPDGKKALSYNFARLRKGMPGYGYINGEDPDTNVNIPDRKGSGLKLIDLDSEKVKELFTVSDIAAINPEKTMGKAFHYFTHCLFAPSGNRFVFFHRWLIDGNKRFTRMISCDLNGGEIFIFPTDNMVSHIAWKDDRYILAYARTRKFDDKYYLFEDKTGQFQIIGDHCFNSDGHPQFSPNGRYILTDTYPDRFRKQHLIVFDLEKYTRKDIASLQLPLKYIKGPRCDFHPRWNRKGNVICFDSAHTGKRSLCTITLPDHNNII